MSDQNLCERFTETMARFTELTAKRLPDDVVTQLEELRKEVTRQLVRDTLTMPARIAEKERELARLREHLEEFTKDPDAVIRSRIDALTR